MHLVTVINSLVNLKFSKHKIEIKYQNSYLHEHIQQNITAAKLAILLYFIYVPLTYILIQNELILLTYVVLFVSTGPLLLLSTYKQPLFKKHTRLLLYLAGLITISGPLIFFFTTSNNRELFQVDLIIPIIAIFTMYGVQFALALLINLTYLLFFLLLAYLTSLSTIEIFMFIYSYTFVTIISAFAAYLHEKIDRTLFVSRLESSNFKLIINNSTDYIAFYDPKTYYYLYANKAFLEINDYDLETLRTKTLMDVHPSLEYEKIQDVFKIVQEKGSFSDVVKLYRPDGKAYYVHINLQKSRYKCQDVIINTASDVTALKEAELQLQEIAQKDTLTQLYNRYIFNQYIQQQLTQAKRYQHPFSLMLCDIDHFKRVNDSYGHLIGDEILKDIAQLIKASARESDIVARWGGEEFVILLPNTSLQNALTLSDKIHNNLSNYHHQQVPHITISCGLTQFREGDTQQTLFHRVDQALYEAKERGRDRSVAN